MKKNSPHSPRHSVGVPKNNERKIEVTSVVKSISNISDKMSCLTGSTPPEHLGSPLLILFPRGLLLLSPCNPCTITKYFKQIFRNRQCVANADWPNFWTILGGDAYNRKSTILTIEGQKVLIISDK